MIESARRAFLVCHNASKSDRGHHQREAVRQREEEREAKKTERKLAIDRQDRESQAGKQRDDAASGRNEERETRNGQAGRARCEALAASIQQAPATLNSVGPDAYV